MALQREKIHNWQENEIKQLLVIRGTEAIRSQIRGTVKDLVVYSRISKLLAVRGVYRTHMQVISKLKSLRKHYLRIREQKACCGNERVHWLFYELCHRAFFNSPMGNPVKRPESPTPPPSCGGSNTDTVTASASTSAASHRKRREPTGGCGYPLGRSG
ncbi:hypothetical protein XENORESO_010716 [Xenotaenia resolanae]|uniref:Myb/SANT-like DNA-binding domain-containing protein n=1 Tax=Xenotaenia resolanae TaxID=208358 RepID=A0ABV0W3V4_9TELE